MAYSTTELTLYFFSLWCKVFHARSCRFGGNSASPRTPQLRQVWLTRTMGLTGAKRGRGGSAGGRLAAGGSKAKPKTNKPKSTPKPVNNTNKPQLPSRFIGKVHDSQGLALNFLHLYLESGCWVPSSTTAVPHSFGKMFNILRSNIHKMGREVLLLNELRFRNRTFHFLVCALGISGKGGSLTGSTM